MQTTTKVSCDWDTDRLLRINEVSKLTTLSKSSINSWVATGRFPKPANLSTTIRVWRYRDLIKWIDEAMVREANYD
jgi:predicted DNA-binding transcriptional regulator AlpA